MIEGLIEGGIFEFSPRMFGVLEAESLLFDLFILREFSPESIFPSFDVIS